MRKQQTLSIETEKGIIVSKPFDFETFCIINENHIKGKLGKPSLCKDALVYMFEGTDATDEVIAECEISTLCKLCNKLWDFYIETLNKSNEGKNSKN